MALQKQPPFGGGCFSFTPLPASLRVGRKPFAAKQKGPLQNEGTFPYGGTNRNLLHQPMPLEPLADGQVVEFQAGPGQTDGKQENRDIHENARAERSVGIPGRPNRSRFSVRSSVSTAAPATNSPSTNFGKRRMTRA